MNEQQKRATYNETRGQQSSQCIGVITFIVFCAFLVWLHVWLYSPGSTDNTTAPSFASAEVRDWLDSNQLDLQELKKYPKFIELKSLRDILSLDLKELKQPVTEDLNRKLRKARGQLDLKLWLEDWEIREDVLPVLLMEGLHSRQQLCALQLENILQVSEQITSPVVKQRFLRSLQELHDHWEGCKERETQEAWTLSSILWKVTKITVYVLLIGTLLLGVCYIFAMTVLKAVMEAIAEAIAHIIATIFTVIIGGFVSFIISALTGRKAPIIHMRNSKEK